jgi:Protein of unknown function (DUF4031)
MAVYVGTMKWPFGRMIMFHMATDGDIEELHQMADKIGIQRKWFQNKGTDKHSPHYDICKSKKQLALQKGATELNDREIIRRCFGDLIGKILNDKNEI